MDLTGLTPACARAFIVSLVLTPIVRDVFRSYNVVDRPGTRKAHAYPIPRVGGLPIAVAYAVALNSLRGPGSEFPVHWLQTILSGAAIIFLIGLADDFFDLKPYVKLMGQIAAGATAYFNGLTIDHFGNTALPLWVSLPLTLFWLLLTTNALNLIDGLDGLCAGMGCVGTSALLAAGVIQDNVPLEHATLPLIGALLGFLFYNFSRATMFLGDSGALLIGFLVGCFGILYAERAMSLDVLSPLMVITVPLMDLSLSVLRRFIVKR